MNELKKAINGNDEDLQDYLELIPVEEFRSDLKDYVSEFIDKTYLKNIIAELQKLL